MNPTRAWKAEFCSTATLGCAVLAIDRVPNSRTLRKPHSQEWLCYFPPMRVAILTISDSVSRGTQKDASGPGLRERCAQLGWEIVSESLLADDPAAIRDLLISLADSAAVDLILTTGGTGIGPRDSTP